ncbi:MAG: DUF4358 domain-containing protein [Oscillospiraceae bacterium]|jgi:transcriptional regulator of heat shock response|nr:DUF4358 domain-containing protein [Oscillospiraceae bacterium]
MKKLIYIVISCLLLVTVLCFSFKSKNQKKEPDLNQIKEQIENQIKLKDMMELDKNGLLEVCYVDSSKVKNFYAKINEVGVNADEIIIVEAINEEAAEQIKNAINKRREDKLNQSENYSPKDNEKIKKSTVNKKNNYVSFFVCDDEEKNKIEKIYSSSFE